MKKLEKIELEMPSIDRVNELDRKIQGNLNRLDSSMQKIVKTLETIKSLDEKSSRIEKIEEVIETLGTTFSSIKTKKDETPAKKGPKSVYVPKVPQAKADTSTAKRVETVKTLEETPIFNFNETPIDFPLLISSQEAFSFILYLRNLLRIVVSSRSLMILMMV